MTSGPNTDIGKELMDIFGITVKDLPSIVVMKIEQDFSMSKIKFKHNIKYLNPKTL